MFRMVHVDPARALCYGPVVVDPAAKLLFLSPPGLDPHALARTDALWALVMRERSASKPEKPQYLGADYGGGSMCWVVADAHCGQAVRSRAEMLTGGSPAAGELIDLLCLPGCVSVDGVPHVFAAYQYRVRVPRASVRPARTAFLAGGDGGSEPITFRRKRRTSFHRRHARFDLTRASHWPSLHDALTDAAGPEVLEVEYELKLEGAAPATRFSAGDGGIRAIAWDCARDIATEFYGLHVAPTEPDEGGTLKRKRADE